MPVDPTEGSESVQDATETARDAFEAPEADASEQLREVTPPAEDAPTEDGPGTARPSEPRDPLTAAADEADRAEQARVVELDEDEYR